MTPFDFEYLQKMLKEQSGLVLGGDKQYLVESRLMPVARKANLSGLGELVQKIKMGGGERLKGEVIEAMTTNESFFFRDKTPFDLFRSTMVPSMIAARATQKRIRIWCAAASTGQEPYSLGMCLKDMSASLPGWRVEILGTDLSGEVIEKARAGIYSQFEVQRGLPVQMLVKYFTQVGELWQVSPEIRGMVQYRMFNLLHDFASLGRFDIVFCRNVLIYFDQQTKIDIMNRISRIMEPDGFLVLGAAETVVGLTDVFKPVAERRGLYCLNVPAKSPVATRPMSWAPPRVASAMR